MRAVPCLSDKPCRQGYALLPDGSPYWIGQTPSFPFRTRCYRCKRPGYVITAIQWNRLPLLSLEGLEEMQRETRHPVIAQLSKDLIGSDLGLSPAQAKDLLGAGIVSPLDRELGGRDVEPPPVVAPVVAVTTKKRAAKRKKA